MYLLESREYPLYLKYNMIYHLIFGLIISLGAGYIALNNSTKFFKKMYHLEEGIGELKPTALLKILSGPDLPNIVGLLERLFFMIIVAFNVSGASIAMFAWITVKMTFSWPWQMIDKIKALDEDDLNKIRKLSFISLLLNIVSMLFALIAGLYCKDQEIKMNLSVIITILLVFIFILYIGYKKTKENN